MKWSREADRSLLERIRLADEQAIASLYDRYSTVVYSIAFRVLRDPAVAEQVLSDIFLEIWRCPKFRSQITGNLLLSLMIIARNRAASTLLNAPPSLLEFGPPDWIADQQEWGTTREKACAAIEEMSKDRRVKLERMFFNEND